MFAFIGEELAKFCTALRYTCGYMAISVGDRLGPYEIVGAIGQGGMGAVFRARDTRLGRDVAIKVSDQKFGERFEREARAIAALNHPHVCTLHDVGPDYLVMELVEGETLAARLKRGKLSIPETIQYGCQIADALAAAHAKGIFHRDLKPGNIMLTKSGSKVLDFGLAKSTFDETLTLAHAVMGTPAYMAPEQREGKPCDHRADIYALGLVLFEMATGARPPVGEPPRLDLLPERVGHVVGRCLEQDPEKRWQTALDLKAELEWAGENPVRAGTAASDSPISRLWPIVAASTAIMLIALVLAYLWRPAPETNVRYSTILPPTGSTLDFAVNYGVVALSPDGTKMVFAATGENGRSQLWLRAFDEPDPRPLEGTEGGRFPFWSPDSRWVAFSADGLLKKIDTRGGPPVLLADQGAGSGGSWSTKGQIVFAPGVFNPMLKVSSDGGATSVAVESDISGQGFPWFLPDGEHFLFASLGDGRTILRVGSLSSTTSEAIGEADSRAIYSEGHLLYLRGTSLVAQPFDVQALRTTGEAVLVAEQVQRFRNGVNVGVFSASTAGLLAYQKGADAAVRQLTWFDRSGDPVGTMGEPGTFWNIELSPDRRSLLASASDTFGNYDMWTYDLARGVRERVTTDPAREDVGVWFPDGESVVYDSTRLGHYDLYRKSVNGNGPEELLFADDTDKVPSDVSHDGENLLYFTGGGSRFQLFLLPLSRSDPGAAIEPVALLGTEFNESFARFSPDDQWIAFQTDESGRQEVYVAPFSRPRDKHQISSKGGGIPNWRQDGRGIFYQGPDGQLQEAEFRINGDEVEVTSVQPVFTSVGALGGARGYDISADEQRALISVPVERTIEPITLVQNWTVKLQQ